MSQNKFKKIVFFLLFILDSGISFGQIRSAELGINGLTCAQCSRSVELKLEKLAFIKKIDMDLQQTNAKIFFKDNMAVNFSSIAKAVRDAGFSVRFLNFQLDNKKINYGPDCFQVKADVFNLVGSFSMPKGNASTFQLVGKEFSGPKEWKQYDLKSKGNCKGKNNYFVKEKQEQ